MAKARKVKKKPEGKHKPLSVHALVLDAGHSKMSEVLSERIDAGWELLSPPVHISTVFFVGDIANAYFLVLLRRKKEA
jgi:hypothetical protein